MEESRLWRMQRAKADFNSDLGKCLLFKGQKEEYGND